MRFARTMSVCLGVTLSVMTGGIGAGAKTQDEIVLGAAVSLTGKYAQNGLNTKNGYDLAISKINEKGGIKIGDKTYKLAIRYYDDESTPARGTELAERLIKQDGVKYILGPYSSGLTKASPEALCAHMRAALLTSRRRSRSSGFAIPAPGSS